MTQLQRPEAVIQGNSVLAERFEVVRVLGAGASSRVCHVRDLARGGQEVALKILVNPTLFDESTVERFIREFEICKQIKHPNIVETYELFRSGKLIAFSFEYVPGADLAKIMQGRHLSVEEIDKLLPQLLGALAALHSHKIIHRDIKPENLIIRNDGVLKVVDLGIMKQLDQPGLTKPGLVLGTAQYLAPEYLRDGLHDERSDIYSVGMVLFELLSGKRRLQGKRDTEVCDILDRTDFALPPMALEGVPAKYRNMVMKALQINPELRYQSAAEMLDALSDFDSPRPSLSDNPAVKPLLDLSDFQKDLEKHEERRKLSMLALVLWCAVAAAGFVAGAFIANNFSAWL